MLLSPPTLLELDLPAAARLAGFFLPFFRVELKLCQALRKNRLRNLIRTLYRVKPSLHLPGTATSL